MTFLVYMFLLISTYVVCERLSVMHKQVCVHIPQTVKFVSKFSRKPLSGISDQRAPPPPPQWKTSDLRWPKFTPEYTPQWKTSVLGWPKFTLEYPPPNEKLQIWDDQSLLRNTPPKLKTSDLRWPKFTLEYPPPQWKTSDLRCLPKFTPFNTPPPPIRFEMTKVYSRIPPPNEKLGRSCVETKSVSPVDTISFYLVMLNHSFLVRGLKSYWHLLCFRCTSDKCQRSTLSQLVSI